MEELQVIETTSGRQFKPWASREDVQAIEQAVEQAVQDPASVTAIASEIASGKQAIASAINAKGGSASATESFSELAQDIQDTPTSGVLSSGIVQSGPFGFLDYVCKQDAHPFSEIDDDSVTVINRPNAFYRQTQLLKVRMSALDTISGDYAFTYCSSLQEINFPNLATISGRQTFSNNTSLVSIDMPQLLTISGYAIFFGCTSLRTCIMANLTRVTATETFSNCNQLESVVFGILVSITNPFHDGKTNLRNITIGQDTDVNLPFQYWTATNVIAEGATGIGELNSNLYNNLLTKLYDHSNDGVTRTLRIGWLARVSAENITYANAKGWTLTT